MIKNTITIIVILIISILIAVFASAEEITFDGLIFEYEINADDTATIMRIGKDKSGKKTEYQYNDDGTVTVDGGSFKYDAKMNPDGTISILNYEENNADDIVLLSIPSTIDGHVVTALGNDTTEGSIIELYQLDNKPIIYLPNTITSIGKKALSGQNVPDEQINQLNLVHLGDFALQNNKMLTNIQLPDTLESIGKNPFLNCVNLTNIEVSQDNLLLAYSKGVLFDKQSKKIVTYLQRLTETEYEIPNGIEIIGGSSFYCNDNIHSVVIPDSVTTIERAAFLKCSNLTTVNIPDSVRTIEEQAFGYCKGLKEITIPESVQEIKKKAFDECDNLVVIVIKDSYGYEYCQKNRIPYEIKGNDSDMSWLND